MRFYSLCLCRQFHCHSHFLRTEISLSSQCHSLIPPLDHQQWFDNLVQRIRAFFSRFNPEDVDPPRSDRFRFRPELDEIEKDPEIGTEALKRKGETNGRMNLPPSNHEGLDLVELAVVKGYDHLLLAEKAGYLDGLAELERASLTLDHRLFPTGGSTSTPPTTKSDNDRSMVVQQACSDMDTTIEENTEKILKLREKACHAKSEYQAFKKQNGLTYDIEDEIEKRSKKHMALWGVVVLFIVFLVESLINGIFFAAQYESDLIRRGLPALLISAVNMGLFGFLIMICWKYFFHARQSWRAWACVGLITFCFLALTFNLGAAHFRDAYAEDFPESNDPCYVGSEHPGQEALCLFRNNFTRLAEFESYGFFLLGLGFIFVGVFDWGKYILPGYPGYMNATRRFLKAQKPLNEACKSVRKNLFKIYSIAKANLESSIVDDHKFASKLARSIRDKHKDMLSYTDEVAQRCGRAIDFYRTANRLAREDISSIPPYWGEKWEHDWDLPSSPDDLGLCNPEYAQSLRDKEQHYIEANLDPCYRDSIKKVAALATCPDENIRTDT